MEISKADWKLFRSKLPAWQEAYMNRLNQEYIAILSGDSNPSDKFWALEERIIEDRKSPGVRCELDKGKMLYTILGLLGDKVITVEDLNEFSDSLKKVVQSHLAFMKEEYVW